MDINQDNKTVLNKWQLKLSPKLLFIMLVAILLIAILLYLLFARKLLDDAFKMFKIKPTQTNQQIITSPVGSTLVGGSSGVTTHESSKPTNKTIIIQATLIKLSDQHISLQTQDKQIFKIAFDQLPSDLNSQDLQVGKLFLLKITRDNRDQILKVEILTDSLLRKM